MRNHIVFLFILSLTQCRNQQLLNRVSHYHEDIQEKVQVDSISISYHLTPVNIKTLAWIHSIASQDTLETLYALNRVDRNNLPGLDTMIIPDTFLGDLKEYSPFPCRLPALVSIHKIIFFSYPVEAFGAYEHGTLIRWGPVSMGKASTPTPDGLFFSNWKSKQAISTFNKDWVMNWYFNIENKEGVSIHEYALPGYPASHACIRLLPGDAYWFYGWADQWMLSNSTTIEAYGTPIIICGKYPFGRRKPWLSLGKNNRALEITSNSLEPEIQKYFPLIMHRQALRDSILLRSKMNDR